MTCSEKDSLTPPAYVNVPVSVAYADVDDAIIVTMTRILGMSWQYDYRRTPALTPDELAAAVGRSRSALYRHLKVLKDDDEGGKNPDCLGWLHIEKRGRRVVIRPLVGIPSCDSQGVSRTAEDGRAQVEGALVAGLDSRPGKHNGILLQALEAVGIENPARERLARRTSTRPGSMAGTCGAGIQAGPTCAIRPA